MDHTDSDRGTFWIALPDFLRYFETLTVCYCEPSFADLRALASFGGPDHVFAEVFVTEPTESHFMVCVCGCEQFWAEVGPGDGCIWEVHDTLWFVVTPLFPVSRLILLTPVQAVTRLFLAVPHRNFDPSGYYTGPCG